MDDTSCSLRTERKCGVVVTVCKPKSETETVEGFSYGENDLVDQTIYDGMIRETYFGAGGMVLRYN